MGEGEHGDEGVGGGHGGTWIEQHEHSLAVAAAVVAVHGGGAGGSGGAGGGGGNCISSSKLA